MIRILQCVNDMHRAGLETMLMNYYRNIDRTKIQFDFLTHRPYRSDYDDEIEKMGGKVYYAPRLYPQNYPNYFKWMKNFFKEHPEYKIVHSHIDTMSYLPLLAAKKAGVPIRIAHSHNTSLDRDFKYLLKQYFRLRINSVCTHRLACGKEAGTFLFGNRDFKVIPNAIDAEKFYFNKDLRDEKRKEYTSSILACNRALSELKEADANVKDIENSIFHKKSTSSFYPRKESYIFTRLFMESYMEICPQSSGTTTAKGFRGFTGISSSFSLPVFTMIRHT